MLEQTLYSFFLAFLIAGAPGAFAAKSVDANPSVQGWITIPYGENTPMTRLDPVRSPANSNRVGTIQVFPEVAAQEIIGFGANLTESSLLNFEILSPAAQELVLRRLFGRADGAAFRFLRVPIGSSDFSDPTRENYTYDDTPGNIPDPNFQFFSMERDEKTLDFLQRATAKNPELKVMLSPWSAPAWMKTNRHLFGGGLDRNHWVSFADYLVRVVREYEARGIHVHALSMQNEPAYANDVYPSMGISPEDQRDFIATVLGPALRASGLNVKLLILDHNWNLTEWADIVLRDEAARAFVDGTAYHCYGGMPWDMLATMAKHPDKAIYQTECTGWGNVNFWGDMHWWLDTHVIGATRMGARSALGWNLILNEEGGPRNGGCEGCRGLVTVDRPLGEVRFNPEYWALTHASRFLHEGARLVSSHGGPSALTHSAYRNVDGSLVFLVANPSGASVEFNVSFDREAPVRYTLPAGAAATFLVRP